MKRILFLSLVVFFISFILLTIKNLSVGGHPVGDAIKVTTKAFKSKEVQKWVGGIAAAAFTAKAAEAKTLYDSKDEIIKALEAKGVDTRHGAQYCLAFKIDPNVSDRIFFRPNVFAIIQIEGQGDYVPASIAYKYEGQPHLVCFYALEAKPGQKIFIHLMDEKRFFTSVWEELLKTKIILNFNGNNIVQLMPIDITGQVNIQFVNEDFKVTNYGYLATAEITVPESEDGVWQSESELLTKNDHKAGYIAFTQTWRADGKVLEERAKAKFSFVFLGGLAVVCGLIFLSLLFRKA
jgi:hypothetical protein